MNHHQANHLILIDWRLILVSNHLLTTVIIFLSCSSNWNSNENDFLLKCIKKKWNSFSCFVINATPTFSSIARHWQWWWANLSKSMQGSVEQRVRQRNRWSWSCKFGYQSERRSDQFKIKWTKEEEEKEEEITWNVHRQKNSRVASTVVDWHNILDSKWMSKSNWSDNQHRTERTVDLWQVNGCLVWMNWFVA